MNAASDSMGGSSVDSVTEWFQQAQKGVNAAAAQKLWERYCRRLLGLARLKLRDLPRRMADEDDVVQDAFSAFYRATAAGRYDQIHDRDSLWRLLVTITENKARDLRRRQIDLKRKVARSVGESAIAGPHLGERPSGFEQLPALAAPSERFVDEVISACDQLFPGLTERQREIAVMKCECWANQEIADRLGVTERTIERELKAIRNKFLKDT